VGIGKYQMQQKSDDLEVTTMRVTKRTAKYIEYLKGLLKVRTGQDYSPDDVVWEALNATFAADIEYVSKSAEKDE
jgi:hypothetical protein